MMAGPQVRDLVVEHLNGIGNVMNLEWNALTTHDKAEWAIQADRVDNEVWLQVILNYFILPDSDKVTYAFRKLVDEDIPGPGIIRLNHGDQISFSKGNADDVERLGTGPLPVLCNLHYAVARMLRMSGAAEAIAQLKDDADDLDFPGIDLSLTDFANTLTAKLILNSGQFLSG
jgi:hypothetical protein